MNKHLGITFSEDFNWTAYIISIIANAKKKARCAEKNLRFQLNRNVLSLLYTSYIKPHLENASDVWGGYSSSDCDHRLEKIQLIAAKIVTGLPIFASRKSFLFRNRT